jgi:hypothetical protein
MQHLRSKSDTPMSVANYDRHGIEKLQHEPVKPLDRLKIPPWLVFGTVFLFIVWIGFFNELEQELSVERMTRRNMLLAMKKTKDDKTLGKEEDKPEAAENEMKSL